MEYINKKSIGFNIVGFSKINPHCNPHFEFEILSMEDNRIEENIRLLNNKHSIPINNLKGNKIINNEFNIPLLSATFET